jgi:hypothetical protein
LTFFAFVADTANLSLISLYVKRGLEEYPLCIFTELSGKRSGQLYFEGYVLPDSEVYLLIGTTAALSVTYTLQGKVLAAG